MPLTLQRYFYVETGDLLETFFRLWRLKGNLDTNHLLIQRWLNQQLISKAAITSLVSKQMNSTP